MGTRQLQRAAQLVRQAGQGNVMKSPAALISEPAISHLVASTGTRTFSCGRCLIGALLELFAVDPKRFWRATTISLASRLAVPSLFSALAFNGCRRWFIRIQL